MKPDLSEDGIRRWVGRLPPDVRACVGEAAAMSPESEELARAVLSAQPPDVPGLVRERPEALEAMGRARRMRMLSWVVASLIREGGEEDGEVSLAARGVLSDLLGEDDAGEGGRGGAGTEILFQDYLAFARTMGMRQARAFVTPQAVADALRVVEGAEMALDARMGR